jgi:hypothetical protein
MLEPDQWDAVLSRITGKVYRGTERISSNVLLNALEVGADPIIRQKVAKRKNFAPSPPLKKNPEFSPCPGGVGGTDRDAANALEVGPDPVIRQKVAKR